MSTKDLFNKNNKTLTKSQADKAKKDLESDELAAEVVKSNTRFLSHINYSKPGNFAFYGSAEKYYEDSFDRVYKTYPYDGSHKEKQEWLNSSSELDLWILNNAYPKSVGHVRLGANQSIFVKGGPNNQPGVEETDPEELSKQFPVKQGNSNIWNPSIYRNSNLHLDPNLGFTVEFWMKFDDPEANNIVPFVIGNSSGTRVSIRSVGGGSGIFNISFNDDAFSGGTQFNATGLNDLLETTWNHYSFSFINSGDKVKTEIYKNGVLRADFLNGTTVGTISQEELYLNINGLMNNITAARTNVVDGMYIDEFRFWKQKRTAEETGRYWNTNIHGGTNTDDDKYSEENRNVDIGIYYKFNEGITGDDTIDATVLDYSGRISNGTITNYSNTVRSTTSALDEYGQFILPEEKDYIIYSQHPEFVSSREEYRKKGMVHDLSNNSSIYHTMPAWITEEDEQKGSNIKELSQVISSYFDNAHVQIRELTNLKEKEYYSLDNEAEKPFYIIRNSLESQGMVVPDLFTEASAFEEILSRSETALFEEKLQDVKNTIYQNIYNNLSYIYKSKGTEKAFRNLIRCFGIDDELVKINMYSDGADYTLEDTRRPVAIKKKFVDFNNADRETALVYSKKDLSNSDSESYIRGISKRYPANLSFTFETQVIFPKRIPKDHPKYEPPSNTEEHIALLGEYTTYVASSQNSIFNLKAIKKDNSAKSEDVKFQLNFDGTIVDTKLFKSVYDNAKFNFAVRLVPDNKLSTLVGSTAASPDYTAELYCVRMLGDFIEDEDFQTLAVSNADARRILEMNKFVSVGALKNLNNPETTATINDTRVKIGSTLFWYDNVTNEEVRAHASDASNFGRLHPNEEAYMFDSNINTGDASAIQISRRDTLAMHWDFSEITGSDSNGNFIVNDLSEAVEKVETLINENSIQFTGANAETIDIPDSNDLSFTDGNGTDKAFTISSWVKVGDVTTDSGVIISRRNNVGVGIEDGEWIIGHSNGGLYVILYADPIQNGTNAFSTVNRIFFEDNVKKLSSGTWHLVTVTYDGTQNTSGLKVYKDGVEITTGSVTKLNYSGMPNFNIVTAIGGTDSPTTNTFEDNIADTSVFDKALSSEEIVELYNGGSVKDLEEFSAYDNVISWWKMGDDQDTTGAGGIKDYVGTNNGTMVGAGISFQPAPNLPSDKRVDSGRFGWFTALVGYEVTGLGNHFPNNDDQVVNREFVYSQKHRTPEVINSEELVEIRTQDDDIFTKDAKVASHFFAVEKSMYQVISDDMINLFATIVEFNDLIGQPVNRYRLQYKALENFRARYFEKVKNVPSLEKYTELYKWIDSSIGMMLQELIPVSSNFSANLRNMIESHVLERNKYWTKFPTMEMSGEPPLGIVKGINELTYNWEHGHFSRKEPEYFASFNGTTSNIEVPDASNLSFDESMSISMWFRFADLSQGVTTVLYKVGEYYININPAPTGQLSAFTLGVKPANGGNDLNVNFGKDIEADRWYNLVMTYDGGLDENSVECYIDGHSVPSSTVDSITVPMSDTAGVLKIGSGNGGLFSEVDLSDVALYEKILTQDEAVGLYNNQRPSEIFKSPNISALVSLWRLDGDSTDSKHNNDGTATDVTFGENITEDKRFLWSDKRGTIAKTDISEVDNNREILRRVATRKTQGNTKVVERNGVDVEEDKPVLREPPTAPNTPGAVYSGQAYVTRALSRPYRLNLDVVKTIHGGTNYSPSTKDPNSFVRAVTKFIPGAGTVGIDVDVADNPVTYEQWKELYTVKRSITVTIADTEANITQNFDDDVFYPYYGEDFRDASPFITGHHNDSYGDDAEIPAQGPFTETWVGGNQHRHVDFANQGNRPELYLDDSGILKHPYELSSSNPAARHTRDEVAKRPVNVRNIKTEIGVLKTANYNFEGVDIGSTPSGWSFISSPTVQQDNAATNKALSFLGTAVALPAEEAGNFGASSHWRVASINRGFKGPLNVSFKAYEGRAGGNYGITNPPENSDKLWLQYSTDAVTWTTAGNALSSADVGSYDLTEIEREIPQEGTIYLRWVNSVSSGHPGDNWAIDDISISFDGSDRLLGNYTRDYEVVQTSSRSRNNRYFVRNEGITDTLTVAPIQDAQDFTLPDRGRTEHVIVERFSAPGDPLTLSRGYLDRIAEEFSVYNSVNYRNLDDRESNTADLSAHSALYEGSQGYMPDTNGMPSIHKINRNTSHEARGKNHDNAFVSYQIPRSDFQYNVEMMSTEFPEEKYSTTYTIADAVPSDPPTVPAGYTFGFDAIATAPDYQDERIGAIHSKSTISFDVEPGTVIADEILYFQYKLGDDGTWTTLESFTHDGGVVSFSEEIDLGQSVHNPLYVRWLSSENDNDAATGNTGRFFIKNLCYKPTSLEKYVEEATVTKGLNDYADYQGAGYRFIRNLENQQVANQRKNNIISQINRTRSELAPRTTTDYVEPVVTWNKPNTHYVLNEEYYNRVVNAEAGSLIGVFYEIGSRPITYSYSNNLENFANFNLANAVDMVKEREGQFIDSLMEVFKAGDLLFHRSVAREVIYPRHKNVGLKKIRTRSEFDNYKFFWKDKMLERIKCSDTTKLGYTLTEEFREYFNQKYSVDVMDSFHYKATGTVTTPIFSVDNMSFLTVPDDDSLSFINGNQVDVPFSFSIDLRLINDFANPTSAGGELIYLAAKGTAQTGNIEYIFALTNNNSQVGGPIEYTVRVFLLDTNGGGFQLLFGIPGIDFVSTSQQYVNIALTYDGSETVDGISVYANGTRFSSTYTVAPGYQGMSNLSSDLIIGGSFDGSLKNATFYNKELTPEEVSRVYAGEVLDSAISRWKIDGNGNDSIGSNDGTLSATDLTTSNPVDFQFITSDLTTRVIGDLTYMGEDRARHMVTRKDVEPLHTLPAVPPDVACPPLSTSESVVAFYQTADSQYNPPVPTTQLYHNPYNDNYRESEGWINRKSVVAEQKPTYNDYSSYSEEIKLAAQNYGLVSEFRISEHMDKYILENGGNFRAKNYDFLTIDGASYDGVSHTLTSGDSTVETSSFYSIAFEDDSLVVTSYPTTGSQATLVTNNSEGYADINPIYSPNFAAKFTSTFDLTNSINTNIRENAAGKFNLEATDEDYLMVTIDNWDLESDTNKRISLKDPFTISVWAQPEDKDTQDYQVLFANTNMETSGFDENFVLYSRFKLPDSAFQYLGLTLAVTQSINDIDSTSQGIFAFFNRDRTPARLKSQSFNHVALQFVPPNTRDTSVNPEQNPFLVKLWLNGEELYGIPVSTLINSYSTGYGSGEYGVRGYSPCQVGFFKGNPWSDPVSSNILLYEDVTFEDGYRIGIGGHSNEANRSLKDISLGMITHNFEGASTTQKFKGLLDEFCVFRGLLSKVSIQNIYNEGVPPDMNELMDDGSIGDNFAYLTEIPGFFGFPAIPMFADSGEFDFGVEADNLDDVKIEINNFQSTATNVFPGGNWANTSGGNAVKESGVSGNTNKLLALTGALRTGTAQDPDATDFYREVRYNFANPKQYVTVNFRVYEGVDSSGDYTLTNAPEPDSDNHLYFQYSADGTNWTTAKTIEAGNGVQANRPYWDLSQVVTCVFEAASANNADLIEHVRWISRVESNNSSLDHWGIDDVIIYDHDEVPSSDEKSIMVRLGNDPAVPFLDFSNNYTPSYQLNLQTTLPVWHRIGVPSYNKVTKAEDWDDEFFDSYVHTDNIDFIEKSNQKHESLGIDSKNTVNLKVNAIKKLLPYEGFYPQDRTVQIANLFKEKLTGNILYGDKSTEEHGIQAALQHFFAPGILYNSIKAGVACDWASYTNATGLNSSYYGEPVKRFTNNGEPRVHYNHALAPEWYTNQDGFDGTFIQSQLLPITDYSPNQFAASVAMKSSNFNSYDSVSGDFDVDHDVKNLVITKSPTERLPFEALLNPFDYLLNGEAELLGQPDGLKLEARPNQYFYMSPSDYRDILTYNVNNNNPHGTIISENITNYQYPYFEIKQNRNDDFRYELAMNNFIAESTKFFIEGEELSSFASSPQKDGFSLVSGSTYYMDVVMEKAEDFAPVNSRKFLGGRYFGPPVRWFDNDTEKYNYAGEHDKINDAAFAPYVPPYFYASCVNRISFTADETRKHSLKEIQNGCVVTPVTNGIDSYFRDAALSVVEIGATSGEAENSTTQKEFKNSAAYTSRMPLSASLELFGTTSLGKREFDPVGNIRTIGSADAAEQDAWVIYSKFECPLFDFSGFINDNKQSTLNTLNLGQSAVPNETTTVDGLTYEFFNIKPDGESTLINSKTGSGIWAGLGNKQSGKGVTVSIRESFPEGQSATTGSLLKVCGFTPETKQVGRVANEKTISEAVVMIPFLEKPLKTVTVPGVAGNRQVLGTVEVDGRNFIKVPRDVVVNQISKKKLGQPIYSSLGEEVFDTSITRMMEGMKKYNVPPLYDFRTFNEQPFVMYFLEFNHTLDKEDLSNIWQGLQPKIAKQASLDSVEISHDINENELFGALGQVPLNVRWMVFKVKQKAEKSYFNLTEDSKDDKRFKFKFDVGLKEPEYGYNYPYDYFTMLEMIQVEANSEKEINPREQLNKAKEREE